MEIKVIGSPETLPAGWDNYLSSHHCGSIFHTGAWQQVVAQSYPYSFRGLFAATADGKLTGLFPTWLVRSRLTGNRLISSPFSYICGPLADDRRIERELVKQAVDYALEQKLAYLEIKSQQQLLLLDEGFVASDKYSTFHLDITADEERIWKSLHKGIIQRSITKARKEGVSIKVADSSDCIGAFHRLNRLTCRRHGIPAQPIGFFRMVWKLMATSGMADFLFAYYDGRPIAAIVLFYFKKTATYMYGASDPHYLQYRPNHLLLWEGIRRAKQKGMRLFDLGRVSTENQGLADFKRRWGAEEITLNYYYWPARKGIGAVDRKSLKYKLSTVIFSKLPIVLTDRLTWLYKHLA